MELVSSQEVDFFRLSLASFFAFFNTFLASLAIFSTRFLSRRSSLLSSVSPFVLNFLDLRFDVEERHFFVGGAREGAEMRKPVGEVESADVSCSRSLRLVEEVADVSLTSVSRVREMKKGSSVVSLGQHSQRHQALRRNGDRRRDVPFSRTPLSFPFLLATTSCSTGATGRITFPFMNWAYSPLLAASRLAADMAVMFKADPLPKDPVVIGSVGVETPDDCWEA